MKKRSNPHAIKSQEEFLGVVIGINDQDVHVRFYLPDDDVRDAIVRLAAFGGVTPAVDDEIDCLVSRYETFGAVAAVTTASVCREPSAMYRQGLKMTSEQIEQLAAELDV